MTGIRGVFFPAVHARDSLRLRTSIVTLTRVLRLALIFALMLPTIMACSRDVLTVQMGDVSLNVTSSAAMSAIDAWRVAISGPGGTQEQRGSPGATIRFSQLQPGSYTVLLEGLEGADLASRGQTTVMVQSGQTTTANVSLDRVLPTLTVVANDSAAAEANADSGTFRIVRSGSISSALAVNVSLAGTATPGADYVPIAPTITMAAGLREVLVVVKPILDAVMESAETVQLTVASGSGYRVVGPASATVTIADALSSGGTNFVQVVTGGSHSCGRTPTNAVFCWGNNAVGQLGDGTTTDRLLPTAVSGGLAFIDIEAGFSFTCGVTSTNSVYCWGQNSAGELGDGTTTSRLVPTRVSGSVTFTQVSAGELTTCALTAAGAAYCWGFNGTGQVGDGSTTNRLTPTLVSGSHVFVDVGTGGPTTCARTAVGAVYCWGANQSGQIGDGTSVDRTVPTAVVGGLNFIGVAVGYRSSCGWTASASYCWGYNLDGVLGDGTFTQRRTPTLVAGGVTDISVGLYHACGRIAAGGVHCWGSDFQGELGVGSAGFSPIPTPTPVSGGLAFAAVSVGIEHTCARQSSGAVYCWGRNVDGQLGDGSRINRAAPVKVGGVP